MGRIINRVIRRSDSRVFERRNMQYREVGKTSWTSISRSTVNLKTLVNGRTDVQIEVRYKTSDGKIFASYPTIVNLY